MISLSDGTLYHMIYSIYEFSYYVKCIIILFSWMERYVAIWRIGLQGFFKCMNREETSHSFSFVSTNIYAMDIIQFT